MARKKRLTPQDISKALGASEMIDLGENARGPLGALGMLHMIQDRLVSRGGRPSDPEWDTKRLVPFKRQTWERLREQAQAMSAHGRKVGPAQLAAILIEQQLEAGGGFGRAAGA